MANSENHDIFTIFVDIVVAADVFGSFPFIVNDERYE